LSRGRYSKEEGRRKDERRKKKEERRKAEYRMYIKGPLSD
jgi:hypothetical protein